MKDVYKGKIKVPFYIEYDECYHNEIKEVFLEITGYPIEGMCNYYEVGPDFNLSFWDYSESIGKDSVKYDWKELKAIIDEVKKGNSSPDTENPVEDGWITWDGGECPVPPDVVVGVKLSNGKEITTKAFLLNWSYQNEDSNWYNIEKYKVVTPVIDFGDVVSVEEDDLDTNATTTIKTNISFDITIKGKTFTLNSDELRDLYSQLCSVEGELQEWSLG